MDTYKEKLYGKILWECYRSKLYIIFLSLIYVLISAGAVVFAISHDMNHGIIFYVIAAVVVACSLWRINRVHNPVALICEKKLLVAMPWSFINSDYHISFRAFYMPVEYNEVAGVSHNWSQLYIGARITGGLVALPVQLSYVSVGDKADFQSWVERKQEELMKIHRRRKKGCEIHSPFIVGRHVMPFPRTPLFGEWACPPKPALLRIVMG